MAVLSIFCTPLQRGTPFEEWHRERWHRVAGDPSIRLAEWIWTTLLGRWSYVQSVIDYVPMTPESSQHRSPFPIRSVWMDFRRLREGLDYVMSSDERTICFSAYHLSKGAIHSCADPGLTIVGHDDGSYFFELEEDSVAFAAYISQSY